MNKKDDNHTYALYIYIYIYIAYIFYKKQM